MLVLSLLYFFWEKACTNRDLMCTVQPACCCYTAIITSIFVNLFIRKKKYWYWIDEGRRYIGTSRTQTWLWRKPLWHPPGSFPVWRWGRIQCGPILGGCSRDPQRLSELPRIGTGEGSLCLGRSPPICRFRAGQAREHYTNITIRWISHFLYFVIICSVENTM